MFVDSNKSCHIKFTAFVLVFTILFMPIFLNKKTDWNKRIKESLHLLYKNVRTAIIKVAIRATATSSGNFSKVFSIIKLFCPIDYILFNKVRIGIP